MLNFAETLLHLKSQTCTLCDKKSTIAMLSKDGLCMSCFSEFQADEGEERRNK
jgi:hypothetical protein